ncbi:methylated-DNA--[protein]-cysteine S-methyltransferase [Actinomadura montaniterrae]|uniref:Methylated-DNA--protein-cysteine methyltransferase n=1 Tax=Actinomadura montaniterrae TaxID=1803903 RepID=A0A6L3VJ13_9ACTN|nr:methylated-DNA--[protein]-cysteine S-methyltransferase [Actinomadura montaniterrae]KAB2370636.1 methylated-DNA--[protein]-cysteine S-methyltransferase [Actinomadura montaniterrae]
MTETLAFGTVDTVLGRLLVSETETGIVSLDFRDTPAARERAARKTGLPVVDAPGRLDPALAALRDYFAGDLKTFELPIDWRLTGDVQRQVLTTLYETVRYGQTITYGALGDRSGTEVHAQVIGQVMGGNPIPLIVPCHRVVASNGLGGYSGGSGVEVKRWLLTLEGSIPATLDWDIASPPR